MEFSGLSSTGNDRHDIAILRYLSTGEIPISDGAMGFHPPLYHLLASVPGAILGYKGMQLMSLMMSCGTLILLYDLIKNELESLSSFAKACLLSVACFLPPFVIFGLLVTNDTLAALIGAMLFKQSFAYLRTRKRRELYVLAIAYGFGLLTKGTFLAFGPVFVALVFEIEIRNALDKPGLCIKKLRTTAISVTARI